MTLMEQAYDMGREAKRSLGLRVSPYYNERVLVRGRRLDITEMLNSFFFAGFDGEPYPNALDETAGPLPAQQGQSADA